MIHHQFLPCIFFKEDWCNGKQQTTFHGIFCSIEKWWFLGCWWKTSPLIERKWRELKKRIVLIVQLIYQCCFPLIISWLHWDWVKFHCSFSSFYQWWWWYSVNNKQQQQTTNQTTTTNHSSPLIKYYYITRTSFVFSYYF